MSDFDAALERLMVDPAFKAALARDPAAALAGYRLAPDELEILCAQVDSGTGGPDREEVSRRQAVDVGGRSDVALHGVLVLRAEHERVDQRSARLRDDRDAEVHDALPQPELEYPLGSVFLHRRTDAVVGRVSERRRWEPVDACPRCPAPGVAGLDRP